jgi:hypothetical protein
MPRNIYSNPVIAALVMASIVRCGGYFKKPCTSRRKLVVIAGGRP